MTRTGRWIKPLFLIACCCRQVAGGEAADCVELANGDRLLGAFAGMEGKSLLWSRPDADRLLRLSREDAIRIMFGERPAGSRFRPDAIVALNTGERLPVGQLAFDGELLQARACFGPVQIRRAKLLAIAPARDPAPIYLGPRSDSDWSGEGNNSPFSFEDGALVSAGHGGHGAKTFDNMPDKALIELDISCEPKSNWRATGIFLALNIGLGDGDDGQALFINFAGANWMSRWQRPNSAIRAENVRLPAQLRNVSEGRIIILVEQTESRVRVGLDRRLLIDDKQALDSRHSPNAKLVLNANPSSVTRISNITIRAWDGILPAGWRDQSASDDQIQLPNGDRTSGRVQSIRDGEISVAGMRLPLAAVQSVNFGTGKTLASETAQEVLDLRDGGKLIAYSLATGPGGLRVASPGFGDIELPLAVLARLSREDLRDADQRMGFLLNWLLLDPIPLPEAASNHTAESQEPLLLRAAFLANARPAAGEVATIGGAEFAWHEQGVDIPHTFSAKKENHLYLGVSYVFCKHETENAVLSIGSDDGSVWWLNGREVIRVYAGRGVQPDQSLSQPLTLRKGLNVLAFAVINGKGPAGMAARFLDSANKPVSSLRTATSCGQP